MKAIIVYIIKYIMKVFYNFEHSKSFEVSKKNNFLYVLFIQTNKKIINSLNLWPCSSVIRKLKPSKSVCVTSAIRKEIEEDDPRN